MSVAAVLLAALPWLFADGGLYIGDVPLLGAPFVSDEFLPPGAASRGVHLGYHHGTDGVAFLLVALALTRPLGQMRGSRLRTLLTFALALMGVYGFAVAANDFWLEQVAKRGWSSVETFPTVLWPAATLDWLLVLVLAVLLHLLLVRALPCHDHVGPAAR